ncbi:MAG: tetratricopeptide repeat protein [Pseudomonadota bacterium]
MNKKLLITSTLMMTLVAPHLYAQDTQFQGLTADERMELERQRILEEDDIIPPQQEESQAQVEATLNGDIISPIPATPEAPSQEILSEPIPNSGLFYDADAFVSRSDLGTETAPREVDPLFEPASRFVVVRKSAEPDSYRAQVVAAQRALQLGRYTSALEIYESLHRKSPNDMRVMSGLAVAQQKSGFTESAIATYEAILDRDPHNVDATVNMLGLLSDQFPSVAFRKLSNLWEKNSKNPAVAAQLGLISAELGNIDDAMRYLGVAASIEPNNADHFYNMAVIIDRSGNVKQAIDLYEKALQTDISYNAGRSIPRDLVYDRLANLRRM